MAWFNPYGLVFIALILIPNIVFAIKCSDGFKNIWRNRVVEMLEQIGRYGCFATMIFNVPFTAFGFPSNEVFAIYLIVNTVLILIYCIMWIIFFRKNSVFRALILSIIPSIVFLFSGIASRSILLTLASIVFAPSHIFISYKNVDDKIK